MRQVEARTRSGLSHVNAYVALTYGIFALLCVMVARQPIIAAIAFCASILMGALLDGIPKTLRRLAWQIPLVGAFVLFNGMFVQRGSTLLFALGPVSLHLESLVYGACIAMIVVSAMNCFILLGEVVSSDEALVVLGRKLPVVSLVASMSIRMVPRFQRQSAEVLDVRKACSCANGKARRSRHMASSALLTHLLANSLESSMICADSMKARGWSATRRRTTYKKIKTSGFDKFSIAIIVVLGIACLVAGLYVSSSFQFYPTLGFYGPSSPDVFFADATITRARLQNTGSLALATYLLYAIFLFLPHIAFAVEELKWRR